MFLGDRPNYIVFLWGHRTGAEKTDYDAELPEDDAGKVSVTDFAKLLNEGGGAVELAPNIQAARWEKDLWSVTCLSVFFELYGCLRTFCEGTGMPYGA
jgi:ketopantoate reductase